MKVLSALHRLKKSPNTFIPVHMHLGPRTRSSQVSLWNLPEELILYILKGLPIRDLLSMRAVNSSFRDIIDGCSTLWNTASFQDVWPHPIIYSILRKLQNLITWKHSSKWP